MSEGIGLSGHLRIKSDGLVAEAFGRERWINTRTGEEFKVTGPALTPFAIDEPLVEKPRDYPGDAIWR